MPNTHPGPTETPARRPTVAQVRDLLRTASFEELPTLLAFLEDDPRAQVAKLAATARKRREKELAERDRVRAMYARMRELGGPGVVVGVDEVGRGPLAGPLTVAAVALPDKPVVWGVNDSKQLTPARREELAGTILQTALAVGIAHIEPEEIDACGMAASLRLAMSRAIADTGLDPDRVLIDGLPVHVHPREVCVTHGDATVACIAAASIVAKVTRDTIMEGMDAVYPGYGFAQSKGYGSAEHIAAIRERGLTPIHRRSFCHNILVG